MLGEFIIFEHMVDIDSTIRTDVIIVKKRSEYDINALSSSCADKEGKELVLFIAKTLKEANTDLLMQLYIELGRDYFVSLFEKTLQIENEGGMMKQKLSPDDDNTRRTPGGIFLYHIRKNEKNNGVIKKIFKDNIKLLKTNHKLLKQISNISL